jgi:hypothetical protein
MDLVLEATQSHRVSRGPSTLDAKPVVLLDDDIPEAPLKKV